MPCAPAGRPAVPVLDDITLHHAFRDVPGENAPQPAMTRGGGGGRQKEIPRRISRDTRRTDAVARDRICSWITHATLSHAHVAAPPPTSIKASAICLAATCTRPDSVFGPYIRGLHAHDVVFIFFLFLSAPLLIIFFDGRKGKVEKQDKLASVYLRCKS